MQLKYVEPIIKMALEEDRVLNDITTNLVISSGVKVAGGFIAKENGVVCGLAVAKEIFKMIEIKKRLKNKDKIKFETRVSDGDKIKKGQIIAKIFGSAKTVFSGERVALNFLQKLSGIATLTSKYVQLAQPYNVSDFVSRRVKIYDTRKTTPGLRYLEKYAVRCGGGYNHRMDLADMVLLKDNHLRLLNKEMFLSDVIKELKGKISSKMQIEVETENLGQIRELLETEVDIIMLDNMSIDRMKEAIMLIKAMRYKDKPLIEISGGVNLSNISKVAKLGIDRISIGALTHSSAALDISLEISRY